MEIQRSFIVTAVWKHKSETWIIEAINRAAAMAKTLITLTNAGHTDIPQLRAHELKTFPGVMNHE